MTLLLAGELEVSLLRQRVLFVFVTLQINCNLQFLFDVMNQYTYRCTFLRLDLRREGLDLSHITKLEIAAPAGQVEQFYVVSK